MKTFLFLYVDCTNNISMIIFIFILQREREEPELWDYHEEKIVRVLSQRLGGHDEAEVRAVLGKMFTNCGDLEVGPHQSRGCGYYPTYANMNHHCR